jgi:hypothetical protein
LTSEDETNGDSGKKRASNGERYMMSGALSENEEPYDTPNDISNERDRHSESNNQNGSDHDGESTDDSVEEVMPSTEIPPARDIDAIERSMAEEFPSIGLTNGIFRGWNIVGCGARVCVEYRIGDARTGRVEPGRLHDFKKSNRTNIAAQMLSLIQSRQRDGSLSKPRYGRRHVKGLGMVFWDAQEASDPLSVIQPSKAPGTVYPWAYVEVEWKHTNQITLEPRRTLPRLLKKSEYWVACFIYKTAANQERKYQQALSPGRQIPQAVLPADPYQENPYSRRRKRQKLIKLAVEDQTDSESEYVSGTEEEVEEEEGRRSKRRYDSGRRTGQRDEESTRDNGRRTGQRDEESSRDNGRRTGQRDEESSRDNGRRTGQRDEESSRDNGRRTSQRDEEDFSSASESRSRYRSNNSYDSRRHRSTPPTTLSSTGSRHHTPRSAMKGKSRGSHDRSVNFSLEEIDARFPGIRAAAAGPSNSSRKRSHI